MTPGRWLAAGALAVALFWLVLAASPFVALYRLAAAVQAHDPAAVAARVNFRTLRVSLTRQIIAALLEAAAARHDLEARERNLVVEAAATLVEPLVSALVTPETVVDLLDDGWPQSLALPPREVAGGGLRLSSWRALGDLFLASETRGFRGAVVAFPAGRPRAEQFRLRLRLSGLSWRLVEIEVPAELRERLTQRLVRGGEIRR